MRANATHLPEIVVLHGRFDFNEQGGLAAPFQPVLQAVCEGLATVGVTRRPEDDELRRSCATMSHVHNNGCRTAVCNAWL